MGHVVSLEDARDRLALGRDAVTLRRRLGLGSLVAQGLEQAPHTVVPLGGAEEDRDQLVVADAAGEVLVDLALVRNYVLKELLEEAVVEVGERLEELLAALLLPRLLAFGDGDEIRGLAGAIGVGALGDEID